MIYDKGAVVDGCTAAEVDEGGFDFSRVEGIIKT